MIVTADIADSTPAIEAGRYKEVNMVGAAVITAVLNAARGLDLPFVFGGDGGTVLVPGRLRADAVAALGRLQRLATAEFDLPLRAAAIPVRRIRDEGLDVAVGKLRLAPGNALAMFAGGGLARADRIMKDTPGDRHVLAEPEHAGPPDLEGLTCRWEPLRPRNGAMIALIAEPQPDVRAGPVLEETLRTLAAILGPLGGHAPVTDRTLRFRFPPTGLVHEVAMRGGRRAAAWAKALGTAVLQWLAERGGLRIGPYDQPRYRAELKRQTDFRKFDDALRVVLDVTPAEADRIEEALAGAHARGRLFYGLHRAEQALMTCLVFSLERSEHVHFIDAAGGGFAAAAKRLKEQRRAGGAPD